MAINPFLLELYLVTDSGLSQGRPLTDIVGQAVKGGVTLVQLREKGMSVKDFIDLAKAVKNILQPLAIPLIINDNVEVAKACGADGIHIGQNDAPYFEVRSALGPEAIIGLSVENMEQARQALALRGLDYIGASPVFSTATKTDTAPALGLDGLQSIRAITGNQLPIVAIGGVHKQNIASIIHHGADGVAVVSAICSAPDPQQSARELRKEVIRAKSTMKE